MKQKFVMEFLSILLLSFAIGSSLPAAVSEESNEPSVSNPLTNHSSPQKEMQLYIQDLRRQKPTDTVTMKKYIKAYSTHHEDYQQSEETKSDKIAQQNNDTMRLHPELIPFEISDAKVPDSETLKLIERSKEERKTDSAKEPKVLVKKDMSTAESIMVKITHPGPASMGGRPRSVQQLPQEVQNAINFFVQKENSQKLSSPKYPNLNPSHKTGTKLSKNWWTPINVNTHSITHSLPTPLVLSPQAVHNYPPKYTYAKAAPTFKKFEPSQQQNLHTKLPQLQLHNPTDILYTFKTDYPVYTAPKKSVTTEHKYTAAKLPEKLITNGDQNLVDLTSLIGQTPDLQLQGLGEILEKQEKYFTEKPLVRPQDSTAPVLFPLGARLPNPRPATEKPLFVINAISYSTTGAPETTSKSHIYNDVKPHFKNTHLLSSTYFKDHIPISENSPDISPNKNVITVVSPRPVYVAPTLEKGKDSKNFQRDTFGRPSDPFQYASGYAFGYRVRDSHTGNDYGHTQNRDTDGITRGEYHIRLPDGRIQNVKYTADEKGFHADVSYQSGN